MWLGALEGKLALLLEGAETSVCNGLAVYKCGGRSDANRALEGDVSIKGVEIRHLEL